MHWLIKRAQTYRRTGGWRYEDWWIATDGFMALAIRTKAPEDANPFQQVDAATVFAPPPARARTIPIVLLRRWLRSVRALPEQKRRVGRIAGLLVNIGDIERMLAPWPRTPIRYWVAFDTLYVDAPDLRLLVSPLKMVVDNVPCFDAAVEQHETVIRCCWERVKHCSSSGGSHD
jgi:hypothetical protein